MLVVESIVSTLPFAERPDQVLVYFNNHLCYTYYTDAQTTVSNSLFPYAEHQLPQLELKVVFRIFLNGDPDQPADRTMFISTPQSVKLNLLAPLTPIAA